MFPPPASKPSNSPSSRRPRAQKSTRDDQPTLPFSDSPWGREEKILDPDESYTIEAPASPLASLGASQGVAHDASLPQEDGDFDADGFEPDDLVLPPDPPEPPAPPLRRTQSPSFRDPIAPPPPVAPVTPDDRGRFYFLLGFAAAVIAAYLGGYWILSADLATAERLLSQVPIFGPLTTERLLARDVMVVDVESRRTVLQNGLGSKALIVSGNALSSATTTLHSIEIRGRLFDAEEKMLAEKSVFCGNTVSAEVTNDLSLTQTSAIQRIQPPPRFSLGPGDTKPFTIVFPNPPASAAAFALEVIGAKN